jgi:tetratricopeptide (TPR) repeat protein
MQYNQYNVFISYSRNDLEVVKTIKEEIERETSAHCWMDLEGIESGAPHFIHSIIEGINMCDIFLFMRSEQSQYSQYALSELHYAEKGGKKYVIVHIDKSPMSEEFKFLYDLADTIDWDNLSQREKLMHDIRKWIGSIAVGVKEIEKVPTYSQNIFQLPQYDSELEIWNRNGDDYFYGRDGKTKSFVEAVKWYRKAAEQGYASAQYQLGVCYSKGMGVTEDRTEAIKWYKIASVQKEVLDHIKIGNFYIEGLDITKNETEAIKWYHKYAEMQGDVAAQYSLGNSYEYGYGVTRNLDEAMKWYHMAAEQGHGDAKKAFERLKMRFQ